MKISGFTMVRNADKYYFPLKESILSILPICDEFIVALGDGDHKDRTREIIESINSPKIKIFDRVWREEDFVESKILAIETNFALSKCTGDWCFYIQADEVVHENDLELIRQSCLDNLSNLEIDGLLFKYNHFFGDYDHYLPVHGWYKNEIRVIRNHSNTISIKDAQSFRKMNNEKLTVKKINAYIFHYGWVRPPHLMQSKKKEHETIHHGLDIAEKMYEKRPEDFDYGNLNNIPIFKGTHPLVMKSFIENIFWKNTLNYGKKTILNRPLMKHEKLKYKIVTWIEKIFNNGNDIFGYQNWYLKK